MRSLLLAMFGLLGCYRGPSTESCQFQCAASKPECPGNLNCVDGMCVVGEQPCGSDADGGPTSDAPTCTARFTVAHTLPLTGDVVDLVVMDANRDGVLDVVALDARQKTTSQISMFAGSGDGAFAAPVTTPLDISATKLVTTRFNSTLSGVTVIAPMRVRYLATSQTGMFSSLPGTDAYPSNDIALFDLDDDDDDDMALLATTLITPYERITASSTSPRLDVRTVNNPRLLAVGDLSGAGKHDFVIATLTQVKYHPRSTASSGWQEDGNLVTLGFNARELVFGKLRPGDETDVLLVSTERNASLYHAPTGMLTKLTDLEGTGMFPGEAVFVDIDGDGDNDIVTANGKSHDVSIVENLGDGTFAAGRSVMVGSGPVAIGSGDFDGDGRIDLAVAGNGGAPAVNILRNECMQ